MQYWKVVGFVKNQRKVFGKHVHYTKTMSNVSRFVFSATSATTTTPEYPGS